MSQAQKAHRLVDGGRGLDRVSQDGVFDFGDRFGDLNAAGAGLGAVEDSATASNAFLVIEDLQAHVTAGVAGIEDETVRIDDGSWAEVLSVSPENGAYPVLHALPY